MAEAQKFPNSAPSHKRWTLTKEAFDRLLAALDADEETAAEKYLVIRRNLVRFFEGRGCPGAEDHADEVINRVARKFVVGEAIQTINNYCYGVARLLLLEVFKEHERQTNALKEMPRVDRTQLETEGVDESRARLECLTHCLDKLPSDSRQLVVSYYEGDKQERIRNRKRLTESLGVPNQALRSRALRLREKLEGCLLSCLKKASSNEQIRSFGH